MIALISLAVIAAWGILATAIVTSRDGYRRIPTSLLTSAQ